MSKANNSIIMRRNNMDLIVDLVRKKPLSRADIARMTGLTRAAVTILTDALIEKGVLLSGDVVKSQSGRRPTLLQINPDVYVCIGVDLSREGCELCFLDFSGRKIFGQSIDYAKTAKETTKIICETIKKELGKVKSEVLGVCVCAPGPIDSQNGVILNPSGLELFHYYDIKRAMESELLMSVLLEKDTNVLAIAENTNMCECDDMLFLLADHGIGCSIVKNGQLFAGRDGMGGELGHTTVDINGPACSCGNNGCAELYASIPATVKKSGYETWEELVSEAKKGENKAQNALKEQARILGALCVNAANVFEMNNIVLGTKLSKAEFIFKNQIEEILNTRAFSRNVHRFHVWASQLGENARAYSSAITVVENYFNKGEQK